jgi:glutamate--cysteine ligase
MAVPSHEDPQQPVRTLDDLCIPFFHAIKPAHQHRIGAEAEKFGVDATTGAALPYEGEKSVLTVLQALVEGHGWHPESEAGGGPLIALARAGASITLEPGGQLELSGAPLENVHLICTEMSGHLAELRDISEELGIVWLGVGFHPFARQADLSWVPKARYKVMREYLPRQGAHGLDMMRRTATVQANFDYQSEESAMRALRVSLRLSPVVTAMFANSPFYEGTTWGGKSYRASVWLDVDPTRQGLVPNVLANGRRFVDYVEWALDAPMFVVKRGKEVHDATSITFRKFMKEGAFGTFPTMIDWETHLNTMFPEVRLKKTIEVRGADSQSASLACALPALWTGIFYDDRALDQADELSSTFTHEELIALRREIPQHALAAKFRGKPLADLAQKVVEIGMGGLERRGRLNRHGKDERAHLERLAELVAHGKCPADVLLEGLDRDRPDLRQEILLRARM